MARDTGPAAFGFDNRVGLGAGQLEENARVALFDQTVFDQAESLGVGLRAARQFYTLSIQDVAALTKVRKLYLSAIEEMQFDQLPSRPFAQGYVRAYAMCLGLDEVSVMARFRAEVPDEDEELHAPAGINQEASPRVRRLVIGVLGVFSAVLVWNIIQHNVQSNIQADAVVPDIEQAASGLPASMRPTIAAKPSVVAIGAPMPAPSESTIPNAYVTPGLAEATAAGGSVDRAHAAAKAAAKAAALAGQTAPAVLTAATSPAHGTFNARGMVYGAAPQQSVVTLQANRGASIIIRGSNGSVYFARQLAAGEAYRAPMTTGLTLDVSDPSAFDVYVNGERSAPLSTPLTSLSRFAS